MTQLEQVLSAVPALRKVGPDMPYLRLHAGSGDTATDADVEWVESPDQGSLISIALTELQGATRRAVLAAVFRVESGGMTATGATVSLAKRVADVAEGDEVVQSLILELKGLKPLEPAA